MPSNEEIRNILCQRIEGTIHFLESSQRVRVSLEDMAHSFADVMLRQFVQRTDPHVKKLSQVSIVITGQHYDDLEKKWGGLYKASKVGSVDNR